MKNQIIIVEGLPSTGKSTTAKYIAENLNIKFIDESDENHPADYVYRAFINNKILKKFSQNDQNLIISNSVKIENGYIVPLDKFNGKLLDSLLKYKIYDALPWNIERKLFLQKWKKFVNNIDDNYVFNCNFLQNPMCETMIRFNFRVQASYKFIKEIYDIIKPLNPIVIYLKNNNIKDSILNVLNERGNDWLNCVINYHCLQKYGRSNNLSGFDGYIKALEERQRRELYILKKLGINYIVIESDHKSFNKSYKKIMSCIENYSRK